MKKFSHLIKNANFSVKNIIFSEEDENMKKNLKLTSAALALSMLFSVNAVATASATDTSKDDVPAPKNSKAVRANEDGTYDVAVSFEGNVDTEVSTTVYASDVVLIADRSGSMSGSRWESLKDAVDVLTSKMLPENSDNLVSVITFESDTNIEKFGESYWTNSATEISNMLEDRAPNYGGTYCADAIEAASTVLEDGRDGVSKYVIFLSDGDPFDWTDSVVAAEQLRANHTDTTLYTVGIPDCNESFMKEVAGDESKYFFAADAEQLASVFEGIATEIKSGYKNVVLTDKISEFVEFANVDEDGKPVINLEVFDENGNLVEDTDKSVVFDEATNTITLALGEEMIPDQWKYTVTYTVKPTQNAVDTFWKSGYANVGDANTDLEGNNTSSGKDGFSVGSAVLSFNYRDTDYSANLPMPVAQVDETPLPTEAPTEATEATEATSATNPTSQPTNATSATSATSATNATNATNATSATSASTTSGKAPATGSSANTVILLAMLMLSSAGVLAFKKHSAKISK